MEEPELESLLHRASEGDREAAGELLMRDADRLGRMIRLRLDARLRGRVDPADVLQEVRLEATRRLPEYLRKRDMPFFLWLRFLTQQRMAALCRVHLGAQVRDVRREISMDRPGPGATSAALAQCLSAHATTPSQAVIREERRQELEDALDDLEPADREVLALRHFEQLSNNEAAAVLAITSAAASKRYARALKRLADLL